MLRQAHDDPCGAVWRISAEAGDRVIRYGREQSLFFGYREVDASGPRIESRHCECEADVFVRTRPCSSDDVLAHRNGSP
jgi:hypothetical protein